MKGILKLVRPLNLVIIAFTMYSIRYFLVVYETVNNRQLINLNGEGFDFFLLVISTVLIAAAGNAINDYFDVKADRINRPNELVVGKLISRRTAILVHWICNLLAFGIALILSARNQTFWYVFIHLLSINALWVYSLYLQKKPLIGNFIIAGLTALVPILCGVHFYVQQTLIWQTDINNDVFRYWLDLLIEDGEFVWLLAFFAFVNNFAREIIKDIEDIKGDKEMSMQTFPIAYGQRTSKMVISLLLGLPILFFGIIFIIHDGKNELSVVSQIALFIPVILSLICDLVAFFIVLYAHKRDSFKKADRFVKLAMIFGILTPFYWMIAWV
ncbi:MAG: geranylgeranylglycerol-phosphate geranylgeranyltransferase [Bacteroidetes bacterium]|nr:geranylgeranylglycerol-phosphate geranylgeranyltransferase [Bacteroidota bacterium]